MFTPFSHTLRSIRQDRPRAIPVVLILGALLLCGWAAWAVFGRLVVVATARSARIEARMAPHRVDAPIDGTIERVAVRLGQEVAAGDELFEIDTAQRRLRMDEVAVQSGAIDSEVAALLAVITAAEASVAVDAAVFSAERVEGQARVERARARATMFMRELERVQALGAEALVSRAETHRAEADLDEARATERESVAAIERIGFGRQRAEADRRTRIAELRRELAELQGRRATLDATQRVLAGEIAKGRVRAPVAGRIGELPDRRPGSYVEAGAALATIIPDGGTRIVAHFASEDCVGRVAPGQRALLRLDAFPWAEYGFVAARVERVGSEIGDRGVRVELGDLHAAGNGLAIQHGLTGTVEVEVERCAPLLLMLRKVGAFSDRVALVADEDG